MSRYELHEIIGQGAWGVVYRATDLMANNEVVAVKVIARRKGFPKSELTLGRRVTHPNVIRIFDYYRGAKGNHCLPMEYAPNGNLRRWMEKNAPASWKECEPIAIDMLNGLGAAHEKAIVHRDLKPENVLFGADGKAKLSDFGHARRVNALRRDESLNQLGTVDYMSPEQGKALPCNERADLYSFGVVVQEMLTGQLSNSLTPIPLPHEVPAHVGEAIRRCLENRKEDRFASTNEVIAALTGRTPQPQSYVPLQPSRKFHVFFYGLTILITVAILLIIGVFGRQIERQIEPPPRLAMILPAPVPQKDRLGLLVNFDGPLAPFIEKAIIAGGKYAVVDRDYLNSNLAKLQKPDATGILGATYSLSGNSYIAQGRLHARAKLIHLQSMTEVTSEVVEGDPADAVRLAEQLAKLF